MFGFFEKTMAQKVGSYASKNPLVLVGAVLGVLGVTAVSYRLKTGRWTPEETAAQRVYKEAKKKAKEELKEDKKRVAEMLKTVKADYEKSVKDAKEQLERAEAGRPIKPVQNPATA